MHPVVLHAIDPRPPSHVLLAIGLPHEIAHGSLLSDNTFEKNTVEEIDFVVHTS